jgi:hypothetical protein
LGHRALHRCAGRRHSTPYPSEATLKGRFRVERRKIFYMLKGMSPTEFENEIARMFIALGYRAEIIDGASDGGIDLRGEGWKTVVGPVQEVHDARGHSAGRAGLPRRYCINNPAEKGYFITTNKFTLAAERALQTAILASNLSTASGVSSTTISLSGHPRRISRRQRHPQILSRHRGSVRAVAGNSCCERPSTESARESNSGAAQRFQPANSSRTSKRSAARESLKFLPNLPTAALLATS